MTTEKSCFDCSEKKHKRHLEEAAAEYDALKDEYDAIRTSKEGIEMMYKTLLYRYRNCQDKLNKEIIALKETIRKLEQELDHAHRENYIRAYNEMHDDYVQHILPNTFKIRTHDAVTFRCCHCDFKFTDVVTTGTYF